MAQPPHQQATTGTRKRTPFQDYLQDLWNDEVRAAAINLQNMVDLIALPDDNETTGSDSENDYTDLPQHVLDFNFCLDEYFRKVQQATSRVGADSYELIGCGMDEQFNLGLHPSLRNDDDHDAVLPTINDYLSVSEVRALSAGGSHTAAVTNNGHAFSWGIPDEGALGRDYVESDKINTAARPGRVRGFISANGEKEDHLLYQVAAGESHTLYLSARGTVYAAGFQRDSDDNKFYLSTADQHVVRVDMPGVVQSIYAANAWSAAILEDGSLLTWGFGNSGELARSANMTKPKERGDEEFDVSSNPLYVTIIKAADGTEEKIIHHDVAKEKFLTPKQVLWTGPQLKREVIAVGLGFRHLLVAARDNGSWESKVYASGLNADGQLGLGDTTARHALTQVPYLDGKNITQLACGGYFSLALSMDGMELYSFGDGKNGCLGVANSFEGTSRPVQVSFPELTRITTIAAGGSHCVAVNDQRDVYTWGANTNYRTGHYREDDSSINLPRKLNLVDYCGKETSVCHVHNASGGDNHTFFLVKRYGKGKQ